MDHIVSGWLISVDTTIDSNCSQWYGHYQYRKCGIDGICTAPMFSLYIYYVLLLRLNSIHQRHKIQFTF